MKGLANETLVGMVNDGILNIYKLQKLVYIKELVDRISMKQYLEEGDVMKIYGKYGVMPNIVTWGDYFQTELATSLKELSDSAFDRIMDTVRFDLISSYVIFSEQSSSFFEWVEESYHSIVSEKEDDYTEEEEEIIHLKILMDYYINLGISDNFTALEMNWHSSFEQAVAM